MNERLRLASIEITQRCNRQCDYCEQIKSEREMSVAQFDALLDTLSSEGVEAIALGGGEPTLHSALPDLLDRARRRGLRAGLTTNARARPGFVARRCGVVGKFRRLGGKRLLDDDGGASARDCELAFVARGSSRCNALGNRSDSTRRALFAASGLQRESP
jgi:hypothetical protein